MTESKTSAVDKANYKIGWWLSAALEDPEVSTEMKADINAWFEAHQPGQPKKYCPHDLGSIGCRLTSHDLACVCEIKGDK